MSYSGTPQHMRAALRRQVERVSVVGPLPQRKGLEGRARKLRARLRGRDVLLHHTERVARGYAEAAEPELRRLQPDVVLSPGTLPVAYLDAPCPVAPWPDATFESNLYFYGAYSNLSDESVLEGHRVERAALDNAAVALFATED